MNLSDRSTQLAKWGAVACALGLLLLYKARQVRNSDADQAESSASDSVSSSSTSIESSSSSLASSPSASPSSSSSSTTTKRGSILLDADKKREKQKNRPHARGVSFSDEEVVTIPSAAEKKEQQRKREEDMESVSEEDEEEKEREKEKERLKKEEEERTRCEAALHVHKQYVDEDEDVVVVCPAASCEFSGAVSASSSSSDSSSSTSSSSSSSSSSEATLPIATNTFVSPNGTISLDFGASDGGNGSGNSPVKGKSTSRVVAFAERKQWMRRATGPSVSPINSTDLFNRMGAFGATLIIDTRSQQLYRTSHVPRSINVPISPEDVTSLITLAALEARCDNLMDKRVLLRRQRQRIIIIGQDSADNELSAEVMHLARLLMIESKVLSIAVVQGGFRAFAEKYPFLPCGYSEHEMRSGRHAHRPAFPWFPNEIVEDFLFLGAHVDAENKAHLQLLNIKHILNISAEVENLYPEDFNYLHISLPDHHDQDISAKFEQAFAFLDAAREKQERVLVHCHQGISRSATIIFAYVMHTRKWTLKETYEFVRKRRSQVYPNVGFWKQLGAFEEKLHHDTKGYKPTLSSCVDIEEMEREVQSRAAKALLMKAAGKDSDEDDDEEEEEAAADAAADEDDGEVVRC